MGWGGGRGRVRWGGKGWDGVGSVRVGGRVGVGRAG